MINADAVKELELQIKLHINQRLFDQALITEEMFNKAKNIILTS